VQGLIPSPEVADLLRRGFVALSSDCDDPEPEVLELAEHLEDAMMLPFVLFADAQGRFLEGSSGAVNPAQFRRQLERLVSRPR
jgi:hypothetical protein